MWDSAVVGRRLREARKAQGKTLDETGQIAGLSGGFLSQIERGISQPSISSLTSICRALGVDLPTLLGGEHDVTSQQTSSGAHTTVTRGGDALEIRIGSSPLVYRYHSGSFPGRVLECLLASIPPGLRTDPRSHHREEFGFVVDGSLRIGIGDEAYALEKGDSYHVPALTKHWYQTEVGGAEILMVSTEWLLDAHRPTYPTAVHTTASQGSGSRSRKEGGHQISIAEATA